MNTSGVSQARGIFCVFFLEKKYFTSSNNGDELISGCFFPHESPSHVRTEGFWWRCAHPGDAPPALLLLAGNTPTALPRAQLPLALGGCISKPPNPAGEGRLPEQRGAAGAPGEKSEGTQQRLSLPSLGFSSFARLCPRIAPCCSPCPGSSPSTTGP